MVVRHEARCTENGPERAEFECLEPGCRWRIWLLHATGEIRRLAEGSDPTVQHYGSTSPDVKITDFNVIPVSRNEE